MSEPWDWISFYPLCCDEIPGKVNLRKGEFCFGSDWGHSPSQWEHGGRCVVQRLKKQRGKCQHPVCLPLLLLLLSLGPLPIASAMPILGESFHCS